MACLPSSSLALTTDAHSLQSIQEEAADLLSPGGRPGTGLLELLEPVRVGATDMKNSPSPEMALLSCAL